MAADDALVEANKKIAEAKAELAALPKAVTLQAQKSSWWSTKEAMTVSASVLGFGLLVTIAAAWLLQKGREPVAILRVFGTILILVFAVFLVVAGYDDKQIAPVMALLGTVAGYLLGSRDSGTQTATSGSAADSTSGQTKT